MAKVVLVTGGSRGIGAAVSTMAAERGYAVCVNYGSNAARAEEIADEIRAAGGTVMLAKADIANEAEVVAMFEQIDRELGPVDALVNSAGITGGEFRVEDINQQELDRIWAVNLTGSILCAREAVRRMSTRRGGSGGVIVNLSSAASRLGGAGRVVAYAASKGGIDTFTNGLAREVADEGIRVCAVSPGVIDTEMHPEGRVAAMADQIPMRRVGRPDEVAKAVLWLMSDEASYVSGTVLSVSGAR